MTSERDRIASDAGEILSDIARRTAETNERLRNEAIAAGVQAGVDVAVAAVVTVVRHQARARRIEVTRDDDGRIVGLKQIELSGFGDEIDAAIAAQEEETRP